MNAFMATSPVPGAVVLVKEGDAVMHRMAYGYAQRYAYGKRPLQPPEPMTVEHLFDLASLTKVFATTFGIMLLVDRGVIDIDDPVGRYLTAFTGESKDSVTIRHLLTHTAGLSEWNPVYYHATDEAGAYDYISSLPLKYAVGAARHYSDLGFMLLGYLIERVSGQPLDAFLLAALFEPLGLHHTSFNPIQHGLQLFAATSHGNPFERRMVYDDDFGYRCDEDPASWNGWRTYTLKGEVNDGNAFYAHHGVAGHAGLFASIDDLQRLVDLLLNDGWYDGRTLIKPETVRAFLTKDVFGNGLGWAMDAAVIQARGAPGGTFGHTGFTGTSVVVVPAYRLSIIMLTNRQNADVQPDGTYFNLNPLRQEAVTLLLKQRS